MLLQQRCMPVKKLFDVGQREVKGARFCYCRIYHKFVSFIILNLYKVVKLKSCFILLRGILMHQTAQKLNKY